MFKTFSSLVSSALIAYTANGQTESMATATFMNDRNGVDGTVTVASGMLEISLEVSNETLELLNSNSADCTTNGFKYHIHEFYNYNSTYDRFYSECGGSYTGGHWDPWLACGSATGNDYCLSSNDGSCVTGSSVLGGTSYDCDTDSFNSNPYACEVGDWSGKYGAVMLDGNMLTLSVSSPYEVSAEDLVGLSVVFHCSNSAGTRAFCAGFDVTDGTDDDRPTQTDNNDMVAYLNDDSSAMVLLSNDGTYSIDVGLSGLTLPTGCGDLLVRIYNDWTLTTDNYATSECDSYIGDFYDPTVTCAYGSDNEFCFDNNLCNVTNYNYTCDFNEYGDRFLCAPGDLTGKYGSISSTGDGTLIGYDPLMIDLSQLADLSVAVQCSETWETVACGSFQQYNTMETTGNMNMGSTENGGGNEDDSAFSITIQFGTIMVFLFSIFVTIF